MGCVWEKEKVRSGMHKKEKNWNKADLAPSQFLINQLGLDAANIQTTSTQNTTMKQQRKKRAKKGLLSSISAPVCTYVYV